jgi:hypothetical protein
MEGGMKKPILAHKFDRDGYDFYVEPQWCSQRLFEEESFGDGGILDPCCGWGRIAAAALAAGHRVIASDIVNRWSSLQRQNLRLMLENIPLRKLDFLGAQPAEVVSWWQSVSNIVTNPPFDRIEDVAERCLALATNKVALICPLRRLPAAWPWLEDKPLRRIWFMTPRPSMPTGAHIAAGGKITGGSQDFCWLIFGPGHGAPTVHWLHRDKP